jgi:MoaA/NifB/PqqE/SkfB family radical SAM enzyme
MYVNEMLRIKKIFLITENVLQDFLKWRTKPLNLQLPVTSKCNSRCKTCNVWKAKERIDIDPEDLERALQDSYFSKVTTVGINGGEITLYKDIERLLDAIFTLKRLKEIHLISNGILSRRLFELLILCKEKCRKVNITLHLILSIDGFQRIHDDIRGVSGNFLKVKADIEEILAHKEKYCDTIHIGCTVSKYNIPYMPQIETFFSNYNIPVIYHLAVPNKRIGTFNDHSYSVLADERSRLLAVEFFLGKWLQEQNLSQMLFYFGNYYYLINKGLKRISTCSYKYRDVTINEKLNFYLCATASDKIGNLNEETATILKKRGKIREMQRKIAPLCDSCIHYQGILNVKGLLLLLSYSFERLFCWRFKFKLLSRCTR